MEIDADSIPGANGTGMYQDEEYEQLPSSIECPLCGQLNRKPSFEFHRRRTPHAPDAGNRAGDVIRYAALERSKNA